MSKEWKEVYGPMSEYDDELDDDIEYVDCNCGSLWCTGECLDDLGVNGNSDYYIEQYPRESLWEPLYESDYEHFPDYYDEDL